MKKAKLIDKDIVVLYHADCKDGFGAAWAAWKKFGNQAEYIPVYHGRAVPQGLQGKEIYMLDFTYDEPHTSKLIASNKRVTAIDHHLSQKEITKSTYKHSFNNNHSGAVLAWKYFHPVQRVPKLLSYVEDQDLWKFKLHDTLELCTYINALERKFSVWEKLAADFENPEHIGHYAEEGKLLVQYNDRLMRDIAKEARDVEFAGYRACAVNAPHRFASLIAQMLYKKSLFSIIWNERKDRIHVSLRSNKGTFNVATLAQKFGGGGHPHSAAFYLPLESRLPWKTVEKDV